MYHTVAMEYENGHDPGTVLMDGIFQRLIELGMVIGQDTVSGDVDAYIHFLEKQKIRTACRNGCLRICALRTLSGKSCLPPAISKTGRVSSGFRFYNSSDLPDNSADRL